MGDLLEKMRNKPERERKRIVLWWSASITFVIAALWVFTMAQSGGFDFLSVGGHLSASTSPFASLGRDLQTASDAFDSMRQSAGKSLSDTIGFSSTTFAQSAQSAQSATGSAAK